MADRYEELRDEMLHLLNSHYVSDTDREKLHRLAQAKEWDTDHDWAYAQGVVSSILDVIDTAGREARDVEGMRRTAREDLKAVLEQHTSPD